MPSSSSSSAGGVEEVPEPRQPPARPEHPETPSRPSAWWGRRSATLVTTLVGLVLLSPWLWGTGFMLHYDLVFVPHLPLSAGTAGIDGGVPRAVPNDVFVALLSTVLPGWLVERLVLLGFFVLIGAGVDRWRMPVSARIAAAVALSWNPWVVERLAIGHWGYLWGYAGLVWVVVGAMSWRAAPPDQRCSARNTVIAGVAVGSLSGSTGGVLVGLAAVILLWWPGRAARPTARSTAVAGAWWVLLNAAWWFPFLALAPSGTADDRGVSAFASRADSPAGLVASLASGGGIWHTSSWFASRGSAVLVILVAMLAAAGVGAVLRMTRATSGWSVLVLGVAGLVLAAAGSVPGLSSVLTWTVLHVPGGGLLRDGQKFAALWVVPAALGAGVLVAGIRRRAAGTLLAPLAVVASVVVPIGTLPDAACAADGRWTGAHYPREFTQVADQLGERPGGVAVFPWQLYRKYAWNDQHTVLDPWQRLLASRVVVNDDLPLRDGVVRGESTVSQTVTTALRRHDDAAVVAALKSAGVRYVIEQKDQPPGVGRAPTVGAVIHDGPLLRVRDVGTTTAIAAPPWWAPAGLVSTALAGTSAGGVVLRSRRRRAAGTD